MNLPCKELKRIARTNLSGHFSTPMGVYLIAGLVPLLVELPFSMLQKEQQPLPMTIMFYIADFLIVLLSYVLSAGVCRTHLAIARKQTGRLKMVFFGFQNRPDRYILAGLFLALLCTAGILPAALGILYLYKKGACVETVTVLVILSVISLLVTALLQLSYSLLLFCITDHEEQRIPEAIRSCRQLMKGHRGRLLYLYLSFIGLQLLGIISFGIGSLWVEPYRSQTLANFYLNIKGEMINTL